MSAMTVIALAVVGALAVVAVYAALVARRIRREDRRDRARSEAASALVCDIRASGRQVAAAAHARDFAATDNAGYIQRPDWGQARTYPRLPEEDQ